MSTTPNKGYTLQNTGSGNGIWGTILNSIFSIIDLNLGGFLSKSVAGSANVTISSTEAENAYHKLTGVLTGNIDYIVPNLGSFYFISNQTTGAFTITVTSQAAGTGVVIAQGSTVLVFVDSSTTSVVAGMTAFASALAITAGGTGAMTASDARTNLGLGALAVLNLITVALVNSEMAPAGEILTADGAGGAGWAAPLASITFTGYLFDYAGGTVPSGFLLCDGTAVSRSTYSALFAVIGTAWGTGDGSTTFNLPDFRRRAAVGSGGSSSGTLGNAVGNFGGEETHTLTVPEVPALGLASGKEIPGGANGSFSGNYAAETTSTGYPGERAFSGTLTTGGGGSHNNIQPSAIVLKIIKT